jgi:uncharacterized membrane protein
MATRAQQLSVQSRASAPQTTFRPAAHADGGYLMDEPPAVRVIGTADIRDALKLGWQDFLAKPSHVIFIALMYPLAGIFLSRLTVSYDVFPLLFPLMAGFALVGPFAALGLYEISRRRELGLEATWSDAIDALRGPSFGSILALGGLLTLLFAAWLLSAYIIYKSTIGMVPLVSIQSFLTDVLTTPGGWVLILIGNGVGFLFALLALTISVIAFPLMLDRHVGMATAVATCVRAVRANPGPMALWGLIVVAALVVGTLPFFVGLAILMPVLGHATWHLYRKVVVR